MSARTTSYTNAAQQRVLQLIDLLAGHELQGLAPAEIARALGCTAPVVTRDLDNLRTAGVAEKDEDTGLWRLTARLPQQAVKVYTAIGRAETRLAEAKAAIHRNSDY